jgi:hypothetical protein
MDKIIRHLFCSSFKVFLLIDPGCAPGGAAMTRELQSRTQQLVSPQRARNPGCGLVMSWR